MQLTIISERSSEQKVEGSLDKVWKNMVLQPQTWARISTPYSLTRWPHVVTCIRCSPFPAGFFRTLRRAQICLQPSCSEVFQAAFPRREDQRSPSPAVALTRSRSWRVEDAAVQTWLRVAGEIVRKAETGTWLHDGP